MTNYEKIKAMSVDEMAEFIADIERWGVAVALGTVFFCGDGEDAACDGYNEHRCWQCYKDALESEE